MSGPLHFTYDDPVTATDIRATFPWARAIVVLAHGYLPDATGPARTGPVVARFATDDHYSRLREMTEGIAAELTAAGARAEPIFDDNRLVDRAAAARAGVGWLGHNTMLLVPGHGPWLLLGSVVTDADLDPTTPAGRSCGTCRDCLPACPTGALSADGLDARLCISTWLQAPGAIPHWIRPLVERRIYGCDDCLEACPPGRPALTRTGVTTESLSFRTLLSLSDAELSKRFEWFYVPHRDPRFLRRNLLVAAGNSSEADALDPIRDHFRHRSSLVRGHAYWALARSLGPAAWAELTDAHAIETVPDALIELEKALAMTRAPVVV